MFITLCNPDYDTLKCISSWDPKILVKNPDRIDYTYIYVFSVENAINKHQQSPIRA